MPREPRFVRVDDRLSILYDPDLTTDVRSPIESIHYVGWGGVTRAVEADFRLGTGASRNMKQYGIRRAIWDAAYGYVSGFRVRDIVYFIITRSLSHAVFIRVLRLERARECNLSDHPGE